MNTGAWRIAVLFTASALGGTYISGEELLRFFSYFGSWGTIGLFLTSICLTWFGYTVMKYCLKTGTASLPALINSLIGPKVGPSLSFFLYLMLLCYTGVIIGKQAEQLANGEGSWMIASVLLPCCLAFWLILQGWRQLTRFASAILLLVLLLISLLFTEQRHIPIPSFSYQLNASWFLYALFYLALHFFLVLTILIPLAAQIGNLRTIRVGMGIGGLLYTVFVSLGHLFILAFWHEVHSSAQPLLQILASILPIGAILYYLVSCGHLIICLACLFYGLTIPLAERFGLQIIPMMIVMFSSAMLLSFFPMVSELYSYLISVAATYTGIAVLLLFLWKYRY